MALRKEKTVGVSEMAPGRPTPIAVAEEILEKKTGGYCHDPVQGGLRIKTASIWRSWRWSRGASWRIALRRSHHVKSAAAYLGIHRNTFQKKMANLGIRQESPE
jgi:hypothetical protein